MIFDALEEFIRKIIESQYIDIFPIINKILDIGRRLPQIIGDLKELSTKLLIKKMTFCTPLGLQIEPSAEYRSV